MSKDYNRFKIALEIQDACNMRALAREFVRVCDDAHAELQDTARVWSDPAVRLFVNKLESLSYSVDNFAQAWDACKAKERE